MGEAIGSELPDFDRLTELVTLLHGDNYPAYSEAMDIINGAMAAWNRRAEPLTIATLWGNVADRNEEYDKPLPEDKEINSAHPISTGRHELYAEALRLIDAKHSKYALVDLVNWLLWRLENRRAAGWVSVEERLPEPCKRVLVWGNTIYIGHISIDITPNSNKYVWYMGDYINMCVTHWMPLPEPPEVRE
jgi:hypothetical protein